MRATFHFRCLLKGLLLLCVVAAPCFGQGAIRSSSNGYFEVLSFDNRSLSYVNELSEQVATIAQRYLVRGEMAFLQPILVSLRPQEHADFEGAYRIRIEERGSVHLDVKWEEPLSLETTCYALSEALLVQYARYNYNFDERADFPRWTVSALAGEAYISLRPSEIIDFQQELLSGGMPLLAEVVADRSTGAIENKAGYWLITALKVARMDRSVLRSLFQQAVAGRDILEPLDAVIQGNVPLESTLTAEQWWAAQYLNFAQRDLEILESLEESASWLSELANFDQSVVIGETEVELNLRALWKYRESVALRSMLEARLEILRLRMTQVNPAYFNAAQSLGAMFETLLAVDARKFDYLHVLTRFLGDREDTKRLHEAVLVELKDA